MKDVEFLGDEEVAFKPKRSWVAQVKSSAIAWVLKHNLAKTELQAYVLLICATVVFFLAALTIFILTPPPYTPPAPAQPSGLITLPGQGN